MKQSRSIVLMTLLALSASAVGYRVAAASPTPGLHPASPHAERVRHAGPGASERPPAQPESTFVSVKDCRLVSTSRAGGRIKAGKSRRFLVVGKTGFASQGGESTGCGIPVSATAISARLTATSVKKSGSLRAYPTGAPTTVGTLYYTAHQSSATGATLALAKGLGKVLTVANVSGSAQLTIDVNGYYQEQIQGMISPAGRVYAGSNRIVSAELLAAGEYQVDFDTDVSNCSPMIDTYNVYVYGSAFAFNGSHVTVYTWALDEATHLESAQSDYFSITLTC